MRANKGQLLSGLLLVLLTMTNAYSWNSLGHRLVAQIAYDHLDAHTKELCNRYNQALGKVYSTNSLVNVAPWLDSLRYLNELWLQPMHYIDIPFSRDGTELKAAGDVNAVSAIKKAVSVLKNEEASLYDKGFNLRVLLHVVGDIHQPMHAVSEYSARFPKGDAGGNLVPLAQNRVGTNLHAYWDNGGGWLKPKSRQKYSQTSLKGRARRLEKRWPCSPDTMKLDPAIWAKGSHQLAVHKAYNIKANQLPAKSYQRMVKQVSKQQIALAGCRLAALLNGAVAKTM